MARAGTNLAERMQVRGTRRAEEAVPGGGTEAHDARQSRFDVAKTDSAQEPGKVWTERKNGCPIFVGRFDVHHEKNGGACERRRYGLENDAGTCR